MDGTIGERVRQLRHQQSMTQRELAERAGVSADLISKLEQGQKQTALLVTLHKIAGALDVDVSVLLARPARVEVTDDDGGVLAIRRAITARHEDEDPASLEDLRQQASYAWRSYWSNRFDLLAGQLPAFLGAARATARATPSPEVFAVLSDAYCAAASMLTLLGYVDLGYVAMDDKPDEADDLLNLAEAVAVRLSAADYQRLRDLPPVVVQLR